jgi:hypothetical protein
MPTTDAKVTDEELKNMARELAGLLNGLAIPRHSDRFGNAPPGRAGAQSSRP